MNQRLVTFGLALAALALFYVLLIPKPAVGERPASRPLSSEEGPSGYLGLTRWLTAEQIGVESLRDRFDTLPRGKSRNATGNILLTTLPYELPVRPGEAIQLDEWISSGNTLVVAAALDDTPKWAITDGASFMQQLGRLTRLKFDVVVDKNSSTTTKLEDALDAVAIGKSIAIRPRGVNPLMDGVHELRVTSDLPASRWRAASMDTSIVLQVAQVTRDDDPAVWVRRQGKGQIIVLGVAGLFSNREIGLVDNAQFLSNIIAWNLGPQGRFFFDDVHQGAAKYYDAKAFFADARLHRTIAWLILLWFLFVLGIQRLSAQVTHWRPPDITAFVATSGEFFASTLTQAAAGEQLLANFFNSIRRRLNLAETGAPLWEWLGLQATVLPSEVAELKALQARIDAGRRIDLPRLQNLLVRLQGKIL